MDPELQEKVRRVKLLLRGLDDYVPSPPSQRLASRPGKSASRRVPCTFCLRSGSVDGRTCPVCDGHKWRLSRAGDEKWDEYTETKIVPEGKGSMPSYVMDAEIARLEAEEATRAGKIDHESYGWERARARQERLGSFREVRLHLQRLGRDHPDLHTAVRQKYVLDFPVHGIDHDMAELGVALIANRMKHVRVPPWEENAEAQRKERTVRELVAQGWNASRIARELRLSKEKVKRMIKKISLQVEGA